MTTPTTPQNGQTRPCGLLESFNRFAQLSTFWQRANAPADLVAREQAEYLRLLSDIPGHINRLIAFADLGTAKLIEAHAEARNGPDTASEGGWRMLEDGESFMPGDEYEVEGKWYPRGNCNGTAGPGKALTRRLATPPEDHLGGHRPLDTEKREHGAPGGQKLPVPSEDVEPPCVCQPPKACEHAKYRMLEVGEIIEYGDEYDSGKGGWKPTEGTGEGMLTAWVGNYRRRIQ